jgi:hypothetical protein
MFHPRGVLQWSASSIGFRLLFVRTPVTSGRFDFVGIFSQEPAPFGSCSAMYKDGTFTLFFILFVQFPDSVLLVNHA